MAANTKSVSVKLDEETRTRVELLAEGRQRTALWVLREAMQQYVVREEKRDALRAEAQQVWDEYRQTGQHVPAADVEQWLASWGRDDELALSACRG